MDRLDHLDVPEGLSQEEQEAFVFAKKGKGKGFKGECFNCGKPGHRAADCFAPGGGKEGGGKKGQKGGFGKSGSSITDAIFGQSQNFAKGSGGKGKGKQWGWGKGQKGASWGKGLNAVEEDWTTGGWGWGNPQVPPAFICSLDSEGFAPMKRAAVKAQHRNPVPPVPTRNRYTHLARVCEEEEANEDIPLNILVTAGEPYPAPEDRIQDLTTMVTFRTAGKFTELGREYARLASAKGGTTEKPKKDSVTPPVLQVLETSVVDQKVSIGISTTEYENKSKYYSTTIHNHTELCGNAARATGATKINEEESQKDHEQTMNDAATNRTDDSNLMTNREDLTDNAEETQEVDSQADYDEKNKVAKTVKDLDVSNGIHDAKEQGGRSSPGKLVSYRKVSFGIGDTSAAEMRGRAQGKKRKELTDEQKQEALRAPSPTGTPRPTAATALSCLSEEAPRLLKDRSEADHLQADACYKQQAPRPHQSQLGDVGLGTLLSRAQAVIGLQGYEGTSPRSKSPVLEPRQHHTAVGGGEALKEHSVEGSVETTGLRPGTQDDKMKMEPTGHRRPATGSTIAFAKPVTSARNPFSSLRTLDTEGTADAGEWRPGAGSGVSNALLKHRAR